MKNFLQKISPLSSDLAALLLRLAFGGLFIFHGWSKIEAFDQYYASFPDLIGIGGKLSYLLVIFSEFGCGILVVLGLFTRLAVVPIFITMIVAYFVAHSADDFFTKELAFLFMCLCPVVFLLGSGRFSIDKSFFKNGRSF